MSLRQSVLRDNLREIIDYRTGPKTFEDAVRVWADAYNDYARHAEAHVLIPSLTRETLTTSMISFPKDFYGGFSVGLMSYWTSSVWAGPGFTGALPTAPSPRSFFNDLAREMLKSDVSVDNAAQKISEVLHVYTASLLVVATNVSSGATTTVKIS